MAKNPITIDVLQTLDAIERRGSFAKASEELNKSTSAVSYTVQKLEEQLDIALFQRQGRRSVLTPAGRLILEEGRKIISTTLLLANKAKQVSTGWEPRISIGVESILDQTLIFQLLKQFLDQHPNIEIDVRECVLNGGWEALDNGQVDLIIGAPGPVSAQKGYRAVALHDNDLIPIIATTHLSFESLMDPDQVDALLPKIRKVITHDTSITDIARSEGLSTDGKIFYVQTIQQKVQAILAGIGIGYLPRHLIQTYLDENQMSVLPIQKDLNRQHFMAWKISNKGKGLRALTQMIETDVL